MKNEITIKKVKAVSQPDSQATTSQVKDWSRFAPQGEVDETSFNYWKYAFIFTVLGASVGMILYTPLFIKLVDVCTQ